MKVNQESTEISGTHLQGAVTTSYDKIKEIFGEPTDGDGYKIDAEWVIEFDDGVVATVYNYKDGHNYLGSEGIDTEKITDWHIGGKTSEVVDRIKKMLEVMPKKYPTNPCSTCLELEDGACGRYDLCKCCYGRKEWFTLVTDYLKTKEDEEVKDIASQLQFAMGNKL